MNDELEHNAHTRCLAVVFVAALYGSLLLFSTGRSKGAGRAV